VDPDTPDDGRHTAVAQVQMEVGEASGLLDAIVRQFPLDSNCVHGSPR
jgi:hypothetical protein